MNKYIIIYKMTGTNATTDGMGFDRVNQSDAQTDIIVGVSGLFSYISGATIIGANVPTDNMTLTGSLSALEVNATTGSFTTISTNNFQTLGGSVVINSNAEETNLVFTRGGTAVVEDDTISKISYADSTRSLALDEVYAINGSVGIETIGYSKKILVSGTIITTLEVEGDADEMSVSYNLAGEGLSEVGFSLGMAEDNEDATAEFYILGQEGGETSVAPGSVGHAGGNIIIAGGDGSNGGGAGTDGGSGGNTYIRGGGAGAGEGGGNDGPTGELFLGYEDGDVFDTTIGSNFFKFTEGEEVLVMGSTALTGSYASSGTQFIEVKNGLIMGVV